jgi:type I restriction enzyme S subunit
MGRLRRLQIVIPPLKEQIHIAATLDAHDARIRAEETELAKLRQVKRGLMDDLLTGKVQVASE